MSLVYDIYMEFGRHIRLPYRPLFTQKEVFQQVALQRNTKIRNISWRYSSYSSQALLFSWECELTLNMKKDNPKTPLATTMTKLKKNSNGLKEKLRRVKSTEKKISSKINKEVRMLFLSTVSRNTPRIIKIKLKLRNNTSNHNIGANKLQLTYKNVAAKPADYPILYYVLATILEYI